IRTRRQNGKGLHGRNRVALLRRRAGGPPVSTENDRLAAPFSTFTAAIEDRLRQGAVIYGDLSFARDPADLAGEVEQELLDVCAWSFIVWCRVRALRDALTEPTPGEAAGATIAGRRGAGVQPRLNDFPQRLRARDERQA